MADGENMNNDLSGESAGSENAGPSFQKLVMIVCTFVILKGFRPAQSFMMPYLTSLPQNFTAQFISKEIYPVATYYMFFWMLFIFVITDFVRYKPVIILGGISGILNYALLLGEPTLTRIYIAFVMYALLSSTDVACKTYLFAKVEDRSHYRKISSYMSSSSLIGRFISGVFAQAVFSSGLINAYGLVCISTAGRFISGVFAQAVFSSGLINAYGLVCISTAAMVCATFWTFMIPPVGRNIYSHPGKKRVVVPKLLKMEEEETQIVLTTVKSEKPFLVLRHMWSEFKAAYFNPYVVKWSIWCWFSMSGYNFVSTNSQILWQIVADEHGGSQNLQNGAVKSISTLTSAIGAYLISEVEYPWRTHGNYVLIIITIVLSALLSYSHTCDSLTHLYIAHIAFGVVYQTILTVAQSEIAQNLKRDSYALIFGFNSFMATGLTALYTYVMVAGHGIQLDTREQYMFFAWQYVNLAVLLTFMTISSYVASVIRKN